MKEYSNSLLPIQIEAELSKEMSKPAIIWWIVFYKDQLSPEKLLKSYIGTVTAVSAQSVEPEWNKKNLL